MSDEDSQQLYTLAEAARLLHVGVEKLRELQRAGDIEMIKFGHRTVRVTQRSIAAFLKKHKKVPMIRSRGRS
jgi:excisionase family DNA binding protein